MSHILQLPIDIKAATDTQAFKLIFDVDLYRRKSNCYLWNIVRGRRSLCRQQHCNITIIIIIIITITITITTCITHEHTILEVIWRARTFHFLYVAYSPLLGGHVWRVKRKEIERHPVGYISYSVFKVSAWCHTAENAKRMLLSFPLRATHRTGWWATKLRDFEYHQHIGPIGHRS